MRQHSSISRLAASAAALFKAAFYGSWMMALLAWPGVSFAQQQFQGMCARVKIVIAQELTLERIGFDARLEISNNDGTDPITDFSAALTFEDPLLSTNGVVNDSSSLFFVRSPTFESVNSVSGDGVIGPTTTAVIHWFIIPKPTAGGTSPDGVRYEVSCRLAGKLRGVDLPPEILFAFPAPIYVKPEPQLEITYFQPRDVQGDDPFTSQVETPVPFTVGVLVKNSGYGTAKSIKIDSQQPKIVENKQNLLLIAQLLGARVGDTSVRPTSLTVNLGDILPGQTRKGAWDMITSLSGEFIEFKASYTHASELGGQETSLIKSLNAYFIAHEVLNDQAGRDALKDFLATTDNNPDLVPNALCESEGNILPVNWLTNTAVVGSAGPGGSFQVTLSADKPGWGYMRLTDPGQARLPIASVARSDGKILNTNNFWTNYRYTPGSNVRQNWLNLFDLVDLKDYTYTVTYGQILADTTPPVTTMRFAGFVSEQGGKFYITPDTQIYFTAEDLSPVSMYYSVTNGPFLPALPFSLSAAGQYPIAFYSTDSAGNREDTHTNVVVVAGAADLAFASVNLPGQTFFVSGDALSVRPGQLPITFGAAAAPSRVDAEVAVFQGVAAWATVANVPSSPTAATSASLVVAGDYADFYRFRVNNGSWSREAPVSTPISLTGLASGVVNVSVIARSLYGQYPDESNAVTVTWKVDPAAPATRVTGALPTPTRAREATLAVSGAGVTSYKWTINNGYYRPETNVSAALPISISSAAQQPVAISVLGKVSGVFQPTNNPTTVSWDFNPLYGYKATGVAAVRTVAYTNIGTTLKTFTWDGRNNSGVTMPPGWYTVRVSLIDDLGHTNFATRLIQVGDIAGSSGVLADSTRGPRNPHARGNWAVWQDQADGNWQIYARDLSRSGSIVRLTNTGLGQENPRTDGRYVVWQGRQSNGSWDLYIKDLESASGPSQLVTTPTLDEVNPAIDWPWIVCQRRSSGNPAAPWQLYATNLVSGQQSSGGVSTQDQLDPDVNAGRMVWQDWRDVGPGEIYFKNLETGDMRRLTTNSFGQYHPAIYNQLVVWQDNRNGQVDIYGFDLLRNGEVRFTDTPENETRPYLDGPWLLVQEDSLGPLTSNLRLVHTASRAAVSITRTATIKDRPALAAGQAVWLDTSNSLSSVITAALPSLQPVFQNRNAVAVTEAMASFQRSAYGLLRLWNAQAGVEEITHYTSLVPQVAAETVSWSSGVPAGPDFALVPGTFLWIRFSDARVVDLGVNAVGPLNLPAGANVFSYGAFPSGYSAYRLLNQAGVTRARAVRMLDAEAGQWVVAEVVNGRPMGVDFAIPRVAVLMLDLVSPLSAFEPR